MYEVNVRSNASVWISQQSLHSDKKYKVLQKKMAFMNVFASKSSISWSTVSWPGPSKDQLPSPPRTLETMTMVRNLIAGFARPRKDKSRQKTIVDIYYRVKSHSESQINCILCDVKLVKNTGDQRRSNAKNTLRTEDLVAAVAAVVESDSPSLVSTSA